MYVKWIENKDFAAPSYVCDLVSVSCFTKQTGIFEIWPIQNQHKYKTL